MATEGVGARHTVRVDRPFEAASREFLDLEPELLEEAARGAARQAEAALRPGGSRWGEPSLLVSLEVGEAGPTRGGFLVLPLRWRIFGGAVPLDLGGEFEIRPVGTGEVQIGLRMRWRPDALPGGASDRVRARRVMEAATQSFLNRVYWLLEARYRRTAGADSTRV